MKTQGHTEDISKGHERRVITNHLENGFWKVKCFTFWKGLDSGEPIIDQQWFSKQEECEQRVKELSQQMQSMGFSL